MGSHGIPRRRPWAPMASYAVVHGHPWYHVGFRGRPPKVPWDPTGVAVHLNMGSHVSCHGLPCDIPLGSAWPPMWHKKKQENRTQGVRGNKVACSYVVVGDDLGRFSALTCCLQPPWHPMAAHGSPWHPMAAHGILWHAGSKA